ncbi:MAG: glycogen synthase GlgA [Alteromonadaceae bacterium]|nr:glycogen synthase GlgA [Alteromonadaceae bacterium]
MNIVFAISEVEDLVKTGGLADVGKALPIALKEMAQNVCIFMPYYRAIAEQFPLSESCASQTVFAQSKVYHYTIRQLNWHGITLYFIDYPEYFDREGLYNNGYEGYRDNGERFSFFCAAVLNALQALSIQPDIIHCHDWHTAMLPFLMRNDNSGYFTHTKSVFTIHNAAFQGVHRIDEIPLLHHHPAISSQVHGGYINLLQSAIECADKITTVSPNYARELLTDLGSHGLHDRLMQRQHDLSGILNGCDYTQWNPMSDDYIPNHYSSDDFSGKAQCKRQLQRQTGLTIDAKVPLFGMVCRLTEQKGFGYLVPILERLIRHKLQLVIIGTGDPRVCQDLGEFAEQHPEQFSFINGFSTEHAHLIEAGADFFLMPSQFEPCGLNQMYSLAYGTVPIVRAVGGLKDTVIDPEHHPQEATGFVFDQPSPDALLNCIRRALLAYHECPASFRAMQQRGMQTRFTWQASAQQYLALYQSLQ